MCLNTFSLTFLGGGGGDLGKTILQITRNGVMTYRKRPFNKASRVFLRMDLRVSTVCYGWHVSSQNPMWETLPRPQCWGRDGD